MNDGIRLRDKIVLWCVAFGLMVLAAITAKQKARQPF